MPLERIKNGLWSNSWTLSGVAAEGAAFSPPAPLVMASVQFSGTFAGAAVRLENSNDGVTWIPMVDSSGAFVEASGVPQIYEISTAAAYVRPVSEAGAGGTAITVILACWGTM